jgi:hypothetical protein
VLVTEEEIETAFKFLDHHGTGRINLSNLKKRLGIFYKNTPVSQYKFMLGGKSELTLKDLKDLLLDNTVESFDPVAEAFKVRAPIRTLMMKDEHTSDCGKGLGFGDVCRSSDPLMPNPCGWSSTGPESVVPIQRRHGE